MDIYQINLEFRDMLMKEVCRIQKDLQQAASGRLAVQKRGGSFRWYLKDNGKRSYIPKSQRQMAENLAWKLYLEEKLLDITQQLRAVEAFLKRYPQIPGHARRLLEMSEGYRELLFPRLLSVEAELEEWAKAPYEKSREYPEALRHPTVRGEMVRSKSEAQISYFLNRNKIPYKYECALNLNGIRLYPDFTTLRPRDRKVIIWEHLGRLDKPDYVDANTAKLNLYIKSGWIPWHNLIITAETGELPLDIGLVEELVRIFYLN